MPVENTPPPPPPQAQTSRVTVLRAPGKVLTKTYALDRKGRVVKRGYDKASEFRTKVLEFSGIDGFADLLRWLGSRADLCVIRGAPGRWHLGERRTVLRRNHAKVEYADSAGRFHPPAKGEKAAAQRQDIDAERLWQVTVLPMFEEEPTDWLLLDFEGVTLPAGFDWRADLPYTAAFLRRTLPATFHSAAAVFYATSSAADPSKADLGGNEIRMRLGFLLDRGITFAEGKRWLGKVEGLDTCTLRPVQVTYTAAPVFRDGLRDPMPDRLGVLPGEVERVAVPDLPAPRAAARRERACTAAPARSAEGLGLLPSPGLDAALERLAGAEGASGSVRSALLQAAFAYVRDVGRDRVDVAALAEALAEAAAPYRSAAEVAGYGLENLIAWAQAQVPEEPTPAPHHPARGLPPAEASAKLREAIGRFLAEAWSDAPVIEDGPPPVLGVKAGAGLGKTQAVLEAITALPGFEHKYVEYYVPDHALGGELWDRAVRAASYWHVSVIRGRGSGDDALCAKATLADEVARAGLNVMETLCRAKTEDGHQECEHAATCPYLAQFRDKRPGIRILPHAALFTPRNRELPTPSLVVIDESFWRGSLVHQRLALDRLIEAGRWRVRPRKGETKDRLRDRTDGAEDAARRVQSALLDGRDPREAVVVEDCRELAGIEWGSRTGPGITPGMPFGLQQKRWKAWQKDECSKAGRFWKLLAGEFAHPARPMQRIQVERDAPAGDGDRRHLLHLHHRRELWLPTVPTLLIDADLDARIARKFWPHAEVVDIPVQLNAHVVQVTDRSCSMRFLLGSENADAAERRRAAGRLAELQRTTARLLAGGGLLVTYKDALEQMQLPEAASTLHLGHLRGRDGYKNLDTAVVAGRLEPAPLVVERMARALFGDEAEPLAAIAPDERGLVRYPTEQRRYRVAAGPLDDGAGPAVAVSVHPDPRAQAILEQVRECEVLQAIARLRLVHRTAPATVYVLTNLPLDLEISEVMTWNALARDRAAEACHRWKGVWLVSPSEQARCAPEIWANEGAAKEWGRRNKVSESSSLDSRALRHPIPPYPGWSTAPAATLVEYRRAGQRGPHPHTAYLPGDVFCPDAARADLEAVAGPVAKLAIVGTVHRDRPGVVVSPDEPEPLVIPLMAAVPAPAAPVIGLIQWSFGPARRDRPAPALARAGLPPPLHPVRPPAEAAA